MDEGLCDRVQGVLRGLAAGDRNGGPIHMALCLGSSLAGLGRFDLDDVFRHYLSWWQAGGFDTGPVAQGVFQRVTAGRPRAQAVADVDAVSGGHTAGCNPAHRVSPLAMAAFLDDTDLVSIAKEEASLTHHHLLAGDVSAAVVVLCRGLIRGVEWRQALRQAACGRLEPTVDAIRGSIQRPGGRGGYAPETLQAALYFVNREHDFASALDTALAYAGPANYCPVLVGAIGGARRGVSSIPDTTLPDRRLLPRIIGLADTLAGAWSSS